MPITAKDIKDALQPIYTSAMEIELVKGSEILTFGLKCDGFLARVGLHPQQQLPSTELPQAIDIAFTFMDSEGNAFTTNHLSDDLVALFCVAQQEYAHWSTVEMMIQSSGQKTLMLRRRIGTSPVDLKYATESDFASELFTALLHLEIEFEKIGSNVVSFLECDPHVSSHMKALYDMPTDGSSM